MYAYVAKRVALVPVVGLAVASLVFILARWLPGDVVTVIAAEAPQYGSADALRAELGLNQPLPRQYFDFVWGAVRGDFGDSLFFRQPVSTELRQALPVTLELTLLSVLLSMALALPLGVLTAVQRNGPLDYVARVVSVVFVAVPTFWVATLTLTFLALWFAWTPPLQYTPIWENPVANLQQFAMPTIILALGSLGLKMRLIRAQMLEVLSQDYMRTARAKGLSDRVVVYRHALRNAMVPVVAIVGNQTGMLLGGAAITETIFNLPGLGRVLIEAVNHRDYPTIQAAVLAIALLLVTVNLITDLVFAWLDPRIRHGWES